jgi:hypothetical protein
MGYYTQYDLEIIDGSNGLIKDLIDECEEAGYALEANGDCSQECKWYDHKEDLTTFSKKHPEALFMLSGEGEDNGDAWHEYYRNGKVQVCKAKLVYPVFNADLLA